MEKQQKQGFERWAGNFPVKSEPKNPQVKNCPTMGKGRGGEQRAKNYMVRNGKMAKMRFLKMGRKLSGQIRAKNSSG